LGFFVGCFLVFGCGVICVFWFCFCCKVKMEGWRKMGNWEQVAEEPTLSQADPSDDAILLSAVPGWLRPAHRFDQRSPNRRRSPRPSISVLGGPIRPCCLVRHARLPVLPYQRIVRSYTPKAFAVAGHHGECCSALRRTAARKHCRRRASSQVAGVKNFRPISRDVTPGRRRRSPSTHRVRGQTEAGPPGPPELEGGNHILGRSRPLYQKRVAR
jgi:hypothetical protein